MTEIDTLTRKAQALKEALRPLAGLYHPRFDHMSDDAPVYQHGGGMITLGDIRRARNLVSAK